jgi:hypothetical protein
MIDRNSLLLVFNKIVTNIYAKIIISLLIACIISQLIIGFRYKDMELVKNMAKEFTVLIRIEHKKIENKQEEDEYANGVIYKSDGGKYSVLTVSHIFTSLIEDKDSVNRIQVITYDKNKYDINIESIRRLDETFDISIVSFESTTHYSTIKLGNDPKIGLLSYIFGYKECTNKVHDNIEFNSGKIDEVLSDSTDIYDGHDVKYDNATISGMSGSPILDSQGNLIAIHGSSRKERDGLKNWSKNECTQLDKEFKGDSYGISVSRFRKYL